jgi:hypothetical protein
MYKMSHPSACNNELDPADKSKILLTKQGTSVHTPSNPIAQTCKLPFAKSIASMLIGVVIDVPSLRLR